MVDGRLKPIVVLGAGGHAKVVIEALQAGNAYRVVGCVAQAHETIFHVPVLGDDSVLPTLRERGIHHAVVAIGANELRLMLSRRLAALGFELPIVVHPAATVSPTARLGPGVQVLAGAVINAEATIGTQAIINTLAAVEHGCFVGEASHVAPRAALGGDTVLGRLSLLGIGASVRPGCRIGDRAVIGAGAVVVGDLPDGVTAIGVPARIRR